MNEGVSGTKLNGGSSSQRRHFACFSNHSMAQLSPRDVLFPLRVRDEANDGNNGIAVGSVGSS